MRGRVRGDAGGQVKGCLGRTPGMDWTTCQPHLSEDVPHLCIGKTAAEFKDNSTDFILLSKFCFCYECSMLSIISLTNFEPEGALLMSRSHSQLLRALKRLRSRVSSI